MIKRSFLKLCGLCALCGLFLTVNVGAQQIEMSSSLNPVGSGARATGMGGAFIAVADDATAASWNPAGLVQLEKPEVSVVYSYFKRSQTLGSTVHPEIGSDNEMEANGFNYASAAYPFVLLNRNMIVSINYQRLFEMNKTLDFKYITRDGTGKIIHDTIEFSQKGFLYAVSPAYAIQVTPEFYLGGTLNFWGDYLGENGWDNTYKSFKTVRSKNKTIEESLYLKNNMSFEGMNANMGFLWNVYGPFTVGGVFKTPFDASLRKESTSSAIKVLTNKKSFTKTIADLTMAMPASYGLGLSYKHSDAWMVAFDVYRTEWSSFLIRDSKGREHNPVDGQPLKEGRLKDTTQLRLGTEYLFIEEKNVIPLRGGLFYDPEPATGGLDDFYGLSFGTGYSTGKFSVDMSYQYRFGRNVSGDVQSIKGSSADLDQHAFMVSIIYYF